MIKLPNDAVICDRCQAKLWPANSLTLHMRRHELLDADLDGEHVAGHKYRVAAKKRLAYSRGKSKWDKPHYKVRGV